MGHINYGTGRSKINRTPDEWLFAAAQVSQYARTFTGRKDITANVGPGVGGQYATACWNPEHADIEVNTTTCIPGIKGDRFDLESRVFTLGALPFVGAITHEAAHAKWTLWTPYDLAQRARAGNEPWDYATIDIVVTLEESRIEKLALAQNRTKRAALAQCALSIVLADFKLNGTLYGASIAYALTVGRLGLLTAAEVDRFRDAIEPFLPFDLDVKLRELIAEYHELPVLTYMSQVGSGVPDSYFQAMHSIASRWLVALRETAQQVKDAQDAELKDEEDPADGTKDGDEGQEDQDGQDDGPGEAGAGAPGAPGAAGGADADGAAGPGAEPGSGGEPAPGAGEDAEDAEAAEGLSSEGGEAAADAAEGATDETSGGPQGAKGPEGSEGPAETRDFDQPQPDLQTGIPGEDSAGRRVVVFEVDEDTEGYDDLADKVARVAGKAAMDRESDALSERAEAMVAERLAEASKDRERHDDADEVFAARHGYSNTGGSGARRPRIPSMEERSAAVRLSKDLSKLVFHDRHVTKRDEIVPGGRLRMRAAVARAADIQRTGRSEVPIWRTKQRHRTEETPVSVGVLTDVSGSMDGNEMPSAVVTYVVSQAVDGVDGRSATATFGLFGHLVKRANERVTQVQSWRAADDTEAFREGALLVDRELGLIDGTGARVLVIFTDGHFVNKEDEKYAWEFMKLCKRAGVAVVWCNYGRQPRTNYGYGACIALDGEPADVAMTLGRAILDQVRIVDSARS